jgi:non-ribosomal peptide synthetase component F
MHVLPLRFHIAVEETFQTLLNKVNLETRETMRHLRYAIGNSAQSPLYDVILNYQLADITHFGGMPSDVETYLTGITRESLGVIVRDYARSGHFVLDFDFHCDVFDARQRRRLIEHVDRTIDAFLADPGHRLSEIDLLSGDERLQVTRQFCDGDPLPEPMSQIVARFEQVAETLPQQPAVRDGDRAITYRQLNEQANQLAQSACQNPSSWLSV